ncbi:MAG: NAD-dependent epimerase/dehydratase family protein [Candidatus Micrarchaeota archaeon]
MEDKVYVTGATGRLGKVVMRRLESAIPLVRKKSGLPGEIVTDFSKDDLWRILADAKAVIHLAGSRDFLDERKAREGNVELTRRIVEALPKNARIIFAGSISVYGKKMAQVPADENTETRPDTPYARTKLEAEGIVAKHKSHVILRVGPIYGSGFEEYSKVLDKIARGKMKIIGDGSNRIPFVHVEDVAAVIENALERGQGTYVIVGECLGQDRVYEIAAKALGASPPKSHIPVILAKLFASFELFRTTHFGGKPVFIPEDVAVLSSDRAFNCEKAKKELFFAPIPLEQGIQEMVRQHKHPYKISPGDNSEGNI